MNTVIRDAENLTDAGFGVHLTRPLDYGGAITQKTNVVDALNLSSGNLGKIKLTLGRITLDGVEGRIIVHDGTNDRLIIGYDFG